MPRIITFDKGSKRKLRGIRWTVREKLSAAAIFLLLVLFCIAVALWSAGSLNRAQEHGLRLQR